jgi:hypothetical protein
MKNTMAASVMASLVLVGGHPAAAERCDLNGQNGADVLVRYPLPDPQPQQPVVTHTNKHVVWRVDWEHAQKSGELGFAEPRVVAVGDFTAGGGCDLVWEAEPLSAGAPARLAVGEGFTQLAGDAFAQGTDRPPAPWDIVGADDLTGDGLTDLLWVNANTGALRLWIRTSTATWKASNVVGGIPVPGGPVPPQWWRPVAVARLEQGGPPGVIWFNPSQSVKLVYLRALWTGEQIELEYAGPIERLNEPDWLIVAVGDFDGDGMEDLIRQEQGPPLGSLQVCIMNGLTLRDQSCTSLVPDVLLHPDYPELDWHVVGPR